MVTWRLEINSGKTTKRFQYCMNPNSSNQFLYLRAIQGHSGDNAFDPAWQDNVLLPKVFTEYMYHVGNANELNSMTRNGLISGGKSIKRGRQTVFFTTVNPMEDVFGMGEIPCDLTKPRIAPYKNTWKRFQNMVFWCNLKLAQEKGLQFYFYQTRSRAVVRCNTLPAVCFQKAACMKTQDELYQKVRLTLRVPRTVLQSNSQYSPQNQDARSYWELSSDSKSYGEICNNTMDHRTLGVPLSAVEHQNTTRENKVKRLIEKFENHNHKEPFIQDLRQTEKINKFSKESQDLIAKTFNTEIFELCENFSEQHCPDCNASWETGIICCSCGRNMESTRSPTEFDQNNRDVTSILGYVIKKNSSRGAKHGPSERQKMYYQAKQMLEKACQGKRPSNDTWRRRIQKVFVSHRVERTPHDVVRQDRPGDASTSLQELKEFKIRNIGFSRQMQTEELSNHSINDPDLLERKDNANDCTTSTKQGPNKNTEPFPRSQPIRQRKGQQFEGNEEYDYAVGPKTGWRFYKKARWNLQTTSSGSRANLQTASPSSSTWDQTQWKTSNCNSQHSVIFLRSQDRFRLLGEKPPANRRRVWTAHPQIQHVQSCTTWSHFITRGLRAAQLRIAHLCVPKTIVIHVSCLISCRTWYWP